MQKRMVWLFSAVYFVSYLTRINFGAVISEMIDATGYSKSLFSLSVTGSFITYGIGQIIAGILGDKLNPKKLITIGFITTVIMNLMISVCQNPYQMLSIWCINGFAQAFMWPPLVKIMTDYYSSIDFNRAVVWVSAGGSIGTMLIYLTAPLLISFFNWRSVFVFSAVFGIIIVTLWIKFCPKTENTGVALKKENKVANVQKIKLFTPLVCGVLVVMALQGMLRDGVTTWMPSYISESYSLGNEISILTGVVMPIFSILSCKAANILYEKKFTNPLTGAGVIFTCCALSALGLFFITGKSVIISVLLLAFCIACMHGVNYMLSCVVPVYYRGCGNISTLAGLINSATYVGSAVSTYGIAVITENFGWTATTAVWFIIAFLGSAIAFITVPAFKKQFLKR